MPDWIGKNIDNLWYGIMSLYNRDGYINLTWIDDGDKDGGVYPIKPSHKVSERFSYNDNIIEFPKRASL